MIELVDTIPDINVQPAEYKRLLGFPRERVLDGRARELAEWARGWYAEHGCEAFYSNLWHDAAVVGELETRLRLSGAWQIVEAMAT